MKQKYQSVLVFIGISILLLLMPLLLTAQSVSFSTTSWTSAEISRQIEKATLTELLQANPNHSFSEEWQRLFNDTNCEVCSLPGVKCNDAGFVQSLDLSGQQLEMLPASIHNLSNLETLLLHNNALTRLPATLGNMTHLQSLRISDNALEVLPLPLRNLCGINVERGLVGNPIGKMMTWEEFCQGI
jgi:hypothetical protein